MANIKNLNVNGTTYGINAHSADFAINAKSSSFFDNQKTINLTGAITGSVTTDFNSANTSITTSAANIPEAKLRWGGGNFNGTYGPIDAAMISTLGADRLAFGNVEGVTLETSKDGGSTWTTLTNTNKVRAIFSSSGASDPFYIGNDSSTGIDKSKYMCRITITSNLFGVYTELNKFAIFVSTDGSSNCYCTITARTKANVDSGADTWVTFANKASISGWSGWNIINTSNICTYGNAQYQYQQLRFTFGVGSHASSVAYPGLSIINIMGFGGFGWITPSSMAKRGHMYTWDGNKNVVFPASVTATSFSGSGSSLTFLNASNISSGTIAAARLPAATSSAQGAVKVGSNITVSSGTISLTKANVTNALGYTPPTSDTTYSVATASTAGLVKPASVITKPTINTASTTSGRYYHVQMSSDGNMFVNVPWSDSNTNYYHTSGSWSGLTYTATANNGAGELKFTIPTGTTAATVAAGNHTHSSFSSTVTFNGGVTIAAGTTLKFNKINAPTTSGGSTYGAGSSGQVLKSNGTTVYWAADNNSDSDSKTSSSNTTSKIYLVGPTSQSSSGQTTYSNSSCYASGGYLYSNGVKVDMSNVGIEWGSF